MIETRADVRFPSGDTTCAAWHHEGTNGAVVVMAAGFGVTRGPGTDRFARRFHEAGFSVLAFDPRHLGDSGGDPRQVVDLGEQLEDWSAAVRFAAQLPEVDPAKVGIWGFSSAGGMVVEVGADHEAVAAVIAQSPNMDGKAATRNAVRHQTKGALLRFGATAVADTIGGWFGRPPRLVPLAGPPGSVALLTTPDAIGGDRILDPQGEHPEWIRAAAARSAMKLGSYRPGRRASEVRVPLLVVVCDDDQTALAAPAVAAADAAPKGEVVHVAGGHYAPFLDAHEEVVAAEVAFLRRHLGV